MYTAWFTTNCKDSFGNLENKPHKSILEFFSIFSMCSIQKSSIHRYFLKPQVLFKSGFYLVKYSIFTSTFYQDLHLIFYKVQFWHFTSHKNTVCCNFELYRCQQAEAIKEILSRDIISKKMCWKLQLINNLAIHNFSQVEPSCSLHFF